MVTAIVPTFLFLSFTVMVVAPVFKPFTVITLFFTSTDAMVGV